MDQHVIGVQLSFLFGGADESSKASDSDEPVAPSRDWKAAPKADDQPVSTEKVRQAAEKAQEDLKAEELKKAAPAPNPSVTKP